MNWVEKKNVQHLKIFGWNKCQIPNLSRLRGKKSYSGFPYELMTPTPSLSFPPLLKCKNQLQPLLPEKAEGGRSVRLTPTIHEFFWQRHAAPANTTQPKWLHFVLRGDLSAAPLSAQPSKHYSHKIHRLCMFSMLCLKSILSKGYNSCIIRS